MEQHHFKELIAKRQFWVQSSKENNFDFDSILSGIYNDPSHFIYEILQNAEDASATEISCILYRDKLEIKHNGKDFDFNDVEGITGIGISTKRDDINSIGKFGVGFKSVFAITQSPRIHSGEFHFEIKDFVVPSQINHVDINGTLIILPFNHPLRTKEEAFGIVERKLETIGLKTLLFLTNIQEIKWQTPDRSGHYYKESSEWQNFDNVFRVSIISENEQEEKFEEFLVIKKPITIDNKKLTIEIAYKIGFDEAGNEFIDKEKDSKLVVFFQTEKVTYLNFLIQGPYKTTPNRENIPLDDEQNRYLIQMTANLVADSIPIIKELGFLSVSFLEILPIEQDHTDEIIYAEIFNKVKEKLLSDEMLLPTVEKNFTTSKNALLARGKELTELLDNNDIKLLFGKTHWLDTNITYDRTRELRNYLVNELGIQEVDFEKFASEIKKEFIERKDDAWVMKFYGILLNQRALWEKDRPKPFLRRKPIIRLADGSHIEPENEDHKIQVYLPTETKSKYKTVKEILTKNELSLKFLTELGLSKPDIFAEIREFVVPKYKEPDPLVELNEYFNDFEKLLFAFKKDESEKKKAMIKELKDLYIIYAINSFTGKKQFCRAGEVYLKSEELIEYFKNYNCVFFVSDELTQLFKEKKDDLTSLLLELGCENKPRRIRIKPELTDDEKSVLSDRPSWDLRERYTHDYDLEGLDNFLENLTKERSIILWNFLLKSLNSVNYWLVKKFFKGEYSWYYRKENYSYFDAKFLKTLKNNKWLVDKEGNFVLPNQISVLDLNDIYEKNNEKVEILIEVLGFQLDEIKILEEKTGKKVILVDPEKFQQINDFIQEKFNQENKPVGKEEIWNYEIAPENVIPEVEYVNPEKIETPDLSYPIINPIVSKEIDSDSSTTAQHSLENEVPAKKIKEIGIWGERFVLNYLNNEYSDEQTIRVNWLNQNGDVGQGYDMSLILNSKEVAYIEVKSKIDDSPQLIEITGAQWEFARKLYDKDEGDKYFIYVVSNAGTEKAKITIIKNPIKLWKEGRLYAHPIRIKL